MGNFSLLPKQQAQGPRLGLGFYILVIVAIVLLIALFTGCAAPRKKASRSMMSAFAVSAETEAYAGIPGEGPAGAPRVSDGFAWEWSYRTGIVMIETVDPLNNCTNRVAQDMTAYSPWGFGAGFDPGSVMMKVRQYHDGMYLSQTNIWR